MRRYLSALLLLAVLLPSLAGAAGLSVSHSTFFTSTSCATEPNRFEQFCVQGSGSTASYFQPGTSGLYVAIGSSGSTPTVLNNLTATTAPNTVTGYSAGSLWINTTPTPDDLYILTNPALGVPGWLLVGADVHNNFTATTDPTVNDDLNQTAPGPYGVGSKWRNNTTGQEWTCVSAADGAADWQVTTTLVDTTFFASANCAAAPVLYAHFCVQGTGINAAYFQPSPGGYVPLGSTTTATVKVTTTTTAPTTANDSSQGYSIGSLWTNTSTDPDTIYIATSVAVGEAAWGAVGSNIQNNFVATTDPTLTDDSSAGYSLGSKWRNNTSNIEYTCLNATVGAAVWEQTSQTTSTTVETTDCTPYTGFGQLCKDTDSGSPPDIPNLVYLGIGNGLQINLNPPTLVSGQVPTLEQVMNAAPGANYVSTAVDPASALCVGGTAYRVCLFEEASGAATMKVYNVTTGLPVGWSFMLDTDQHWFLGDGSHCKVVDHTTGAITYDANQSCMPSASGAAAIDDSDGTQCLVPELTDIRTGDGKHWWVRCADNDAGLMYFVVAPPPNWYTSGTVEVSGRVVNTASTADGNFLLGVRLECVRPGTDTIPSSYTSATEAATNTITFATQYRAERWTATVTPHGTCDANSRLYGRIEVDATGTTSNDMGVGTCAGSTGCVYIAADVQVKVLLATSP